MNLNQNGIGFLVGLEYVLDEYKDEDIDDEISYASKIQEITEGIEFDELNLVLRTLSKDDINRINRNISNKELLFSPLPKISKYVLDYSGTSTEMNYKFNSLITGLRLFKRGNIYLSGFRWPNSNFYVVENTPSGLVEPYFIKHAEIKDAKKIINYVNQFRPSDNKLLTCVSWFNKRYEEFDGSSYNELLDLMISSESFFCDEKHYQNTGSVIGLACSMLIGKDNDERKKIKINYEDAYSIRNIIIHGGNINRLNKRAKKNLKKLDLLNENISEYIRRSFKKYYLDSH